MIRKLAKDEMDDLIRRKDAFQAHCENLNPEAEGGKWRLNSDGSGTCSVCHFTQSAVWDDDGWQNFCGHCGADMRLEPPKEE